MPERAPSRRRLRSLLTLEVVLRLAAVLLAAAVVVRMLLGGAAGFWSIVLVLVAAAALWGSVGLYRRLRAVLAEARVEAGDWLAASRLSAAMATRTRSRVAAVLASLIVVVHAGITGYVGAWTILVAIILAGVATLLSPDLRLVGLLGATAVVSLATVAVGCWMTAPRSGWWSKRPKLDIRLGI